MDGVLTDSEPAFHAAVNDVLARFDEHISIDDYRPFIGTPTPEMWRQMAVLKRLDADPARLTEEYEAPLMARLRQPRPPLPGARELIDALRARHVPIALCTASYARWADAILESAGLTGLFDAISTPELVSATKPDPAPYVLAAKMLGLTPPECIAVEDSTPGVTSALRAGAYVIQLRATRTAADPVPGVARVMTSLAQFPLELLETD